MSTVPSNPGSTYVHVGNPDTALGPTWTYMLTVPSNPGGIRMLTVSSNPGSTC